MPEIPYTVRLAPKLLERIEKTARERGISPRKLIRAVLAERFDGDGRPHLGGPIDESNQRPSLDQILFDLTRTRLTLQHLLDHQVGSEMTDQIRQTAQQEAERYMQRLRRRGYEFVTNRHQIRIELRFSRDAAAPLSSNPAALDSDLGGFRSFLRLVLGRPHLGTGRAPIFRPLVPRLALHPEGPALLPLAPVPRRPCTIGSMYST